MSQMIASDMANPEFHGRSDPDAALSVIFYSKPLKNEFESEQQGRPIFYDADMVKIFLPGDDKNVIDTFARDDHKARFPKQWSHYQNKLSGDGRLAGKTPIDQWPRISPAQAEELRAIKFLAVEDIANASDSQIQALGMIGGMSPHAFRDSARAYLRVAAGEATESKTVAALTAVTEENSALKLQQAEMAQQMAAMQKQLAALAQANTAPLGLEALASANPASDDTPAKADKQKRGA